MKIEFLGTADSAGIPVHNCKCEICNCYRQKGLINLSTNAFIKINDKIILLDCGIENISNIFDGKEIIAVLLTHFHSDHCLGLLRLRHSKQNITCFHPKDKEGFSDLFKHKHSITYIENKPFESFKIDELLITPIALIHSKNTNGYLIEYKNFKLAYLTDCAGIKFETIEFLKSKNIDLAFLDACYDERKIQGNHLNYLQASKLLDELEVKEGYLIHASHTTLEYIKNNKIVSKYKYINKGFFKEIK
ncbi:MBL fold metallo-hydrolase [Malaciobacter mytili]|uniref:MBL fold metallo-hydrolase n=1 Tax=Malaciobacter mytili TaxID=603050 RepID=UPI00100AC0A4|nr:MBL fold metallo-hydrolase [Malaciobacter mytili]RXI37570.1 MBL fold metallo-hydrolase [Malaciobacter mytili]